MIWSHRGNETRNTVLQLKLDDPKSKEEKEEAQVEGQLGQRRGRRRSKESSLLSEPRALLLRLLLLPAPHYQALSLTLLEVFFSQLFQ